MWIAKFLASRVRNSEFRTSDVALAHASRNVSNTVIEALAQRTYSTTFDKSALTDPRWLHDFRTRIGKCINFGLNPSQTERAGHLVNEVAHNWRALVAGAEGYLTSPNRAGLLRHHVQWGEQDSMGHVNNVVYNRWAESARVNWIQNFARSIDPSNASQWRELGTPVGKGMILRSIRTDFKFPMTYPDRVSVFHKLSTPVEEGSDAFVLDVVMLSEKQRRIAARCVEDIVMYDYRAAKKTRLGELSFTLKAFEQTLQAQDEEAQRRREQRQRLTEGLRELELESWDRPDAKEDFGSAAT